MTRPLTTERLGGLFELLLANYGPQHWWPGQTRFEIAIGAILVQNTSWTNAARAIAQIAQRGLLQADAMIACEESELLQAVRPAGIYRQKARRIRCFAAWLDRQGGFDTLATLETQALRDSLLAVHGIGPETADCILLYALGRPVFVVDAYARRILSRLGLFAPDRHSDEDLARCMLEASEADVAVLNELHALLVEHGKRVCRPRPRCGECPLTETCAYGHGDNRGT